MPGLVGKLASPFPSHHFLNARKSAAYSCRVRGALDEAAYRFALSISGARTANCSGEICVLWGSSGERVASGNGLGGRRGISVKIARP